MSANSLTNLGLCSPVRRPAMSCQTSTWASQSGPAPMPIVGMCSCALTCAGELGRHDFENHRERAGLLHRLRVLHQAVRGLVAATLYPVAAERVDRLRGQADVSHDRDTCVHERLDLRQHAMAAFELDRLSPTLLHEAGCGLQRLSRRGLVAAERQVGDDDRALRAPNDAAHQRQQFVDGHGQRGVVPVDDVRGGVPDEKNRHASLVEHPRRRVVVRGEHGPSLARVRRALQIADGDAAILHSAVEGFGHLAPTLSSRPACRSPGSWCGTNAPMVHCAPVDCLCERCHPSRST